jgi:low affinity Fe/Cu permease
MEQKFRKPVEPDLKHWRLKWDLAEAHCFGCWECRSRSFCCWRCFGITEVPTESTSVRNRAQLKADAAADSASGAGSSSSASHLFGKIANITSRAAGRASAFAVASLVVIVWAVTGPLFGYSDTWQLVINTGTTIVTFLMVFLIQNSQNRDGAAIQVKLDELIRVSAAHNSFVGIEHLTDEELEDIRTKCELRAKAEKAGEATVERAGKRARRAADRAVG